MRYLRLGRTGLRVAGLCLGTMSFGGGTPPDEAKAVFGRYVENGGNFFDTAVNYAGGASEQILGQLTRPERDRFVIATKYSAPLRSGDPNSGGNQAKSMRQALETSLRRLTTDYIDLYWVHAWDGSTPLEEIVRILDDAIVAGKVLHAGISNAPAWAVARAVTLAEAQMRAPVSAIQVEYSLAERSVERELVPMSENLGLGVLAWGPLCGGLLTGKYLDGADESNGAARLAAGDRRFTSRNLSIAAEVVRIAGELELPAAAVALAWLRARPGSPIPIVGARTADQLAEQLQCLELELPREATEALERVSAVPLGYPHDFLARIRRGYAPLLQPAAARTET